MRPVENLKDKIQPVTLYIAYSMKHTLCGIEYSDNPNRKSNGTLWNWICSTNISQAITEAFHYCRIRITDVFCELQSAFLSYCKTSDDEMVKNDRMVTLSRRFLI